MTTITDEYMRDMLQKTKPYTLLILRPGPQRQQPGIEQIIWEHGRRNFALRAQGVLAIVCPVPNGSDVNGIGLFNATVEEVKALMDEDPAVKAGIFVYDVHACRSFPGDALPMV